MYGKVEHEAGKDLLRIHYANDYVECTPEHWIFSPDGTFKEADKFKKGDLIVTNPTTITSITDIEIISPEKTYNFEVDDQRSYIANNLLVHNMGLGKFAGYTHTPLSNANNRHRIEWMNTNNRWESQPNMMPFFLHAGEIAPRASDFYYRITQSRYATNWSQGGPANWSAAAMEPYWESSAMLLP